MMRGIRRLVVFAAATGLLATAAVSASLGVAQADNFAAACGGNTGNSFICNLDTTISSPGSITLRSAAPAQFVTRLAAKPQVMASHAGADGGMA